MERQEVAIPIAASKPLRLYVGDLERLDGMLWERPKQVTGFCPAADLLIHPTNPCSLPASDNNDMRGNGELRLAQSKHFPISKRNRCQCKNDCG